MNNLGRTALITGASGGIGYELAKLFAKDRYNLVLVARSESKLIQLADELHQHYEVSVLPLTLDLAREEAPEILFKKLASNGIAVEVLVNNAGYGRLGRFAEVPLDDSIGQIQLNISALTRLTRLFLPSMMKRRRGKILNVASTAGFQPGPLMAVYYATKAYVISFSEALANELKGSGVTVTCLCPGPTETGFAERAGNMKSRAFQWIRPMSASAVARLGYGAVMKGRSLVIAGFMNRLLAESVRVSPRTVVTAVSRWVSENAG
jgi:short-subunit dehydrogenase